MVADKGRQWGSFTLADATSPMPFGKPWYIVMDMHGQVARPSSMLLQLL